MMLDVPFLRRDIVCPNCGRILYYTRDMSLVVADYLTLMLHKMLVKVFQS